MKSKFCSPDKKVIFFDLHDTLIDRDLSFAQALHQSLEEFTARWDNQQWNPTLAVEVYQKEWTRKMVSLKKGRIHAKKRRLVQTKVQRQLICLAKSLQDSPFEVTDSFLRTLLKRTKELYSQHISLYPDVQQTLEHLKEQYTLAIISNGRRERLIQAIKHARLAPIFPDHTIFAPTSPRIKKPHPDIFHKALKSMGIEPHQAVMVGNSWKNDIFGGNRCGLDTVWIQSKNQKPHIKRIGRNKVITIARFKQLLSLFN